MTSRLNTDDPLTREVVDLIAQLARQQREIAELRRQLADLRDSVSVNQQQLDRLRQRLEGGR